MAENPTQPVRPTQIANNIGIATISNPPVNSLSTDVCDKLLESFDEFEKARVRVVIIGANPNRRSGLPVTTSAKYHSTATTP